MKSVSIFLLLIAFVPGIPGSASAAPLSPPAVSGLDLQPNGTFTLDQIAAFAGHFDKEWTRTDQGRFRPEAGFPRQAGAAWETGVLFSIQDVAEPLKLSQRVERIDDDAFRLSYRAEHSPGAPGREMFLQLEIPLSIAAGKSILMDGVGHALPVEFRESLLFAGYETQRRTLVLPGATGTVKIEGVFSVLVQDQRQWKREAYSLRLRFSPESDPLLKAGLDVTVRHTPHQSDPISIRAAANFGFRDEVSGDEKGGWTDQGPDNDLRSLPTGPLKAAGVTFDIIDAETNGGRAAIVLGKDDQSFLPKTATVPVGANAETKTWRNLYLLHASGWTPVAGKTVGRVILRHADGSETTKDIVSGRDIANWWAPAMQENAAVGWTGENARSGVGLYVSKISLGSAPLTGIRFESVGAAMWMIAAVSASADDIVPFAPPAAWVSAANHEWVAYKHGLDIEPGSVFDFSAQTETPAGKHGALVVTPAGHFEFTDKPGERARFWGVNLCFGANFLEKEVADRLAERLARSGYNSVRFHHYDRELQLKGGASWELDPEKLDRFDYLFAAMKKRGIYVNIDLYTSRTFSPEEFAALGFEAMTNISATGNMHWRFKALMPVSEKAFDTWSKFARTLITHRNPYTGLTWGEDPALIGICPVNENSPAGLINSDPVVNRAYTDAFEVWWAMPANRTPAGEDRAQAFNRFVYEAQISLDTRMREFLRGLGVKTPITGSNFANGQGLAFVRRHYDYVDNHEYWDHPTFPQQNFRFPFQFRQASSVRFAAQTPRSIMPTRIPGKPFAVTEFNFVHPNRYRAEAGVIMPAYAGLQDWDALYNFDYASNSYNIIHPGVGGGAFSISGDPIGQIADRVGAALFLRGDIAPAKKEVGFAVQPGTAFMSREKSFPDVFSRLGLVTRIGSRPASPAEFLDDAKLAAVVVETADYRTGADRGTYPADQSLAENLERDGVIPTGSISPDGKRYLSDTRQIELKSDEGSLKVVTPRSELFVLPPQVTLSGERVSVSNGDTFGTVSVVAVDGHPIAESGRLLVTHLTDVLPTGVDFKSADRKLQESVGKLPHLVLRGSAELTLKLTEGGSYQAWALAPSGARLREVPLTKTSGGWLLKVETVTKEGTQLAYEIKRN